MKNCKVKNKKLLDILSAYDSKNPVVKSVMKGGEGFISNRNTTKEV